MPTYKSLAFKGRAARGLIIQPGWTASLSKHGLMTGSVDYMVAMGLEFSLQPRIGSPHPFVPIMKMESLTIRGKGDGWSIMECGYAGAEEEYVFGPNFQGEYELLYSVGEEPIETHPDFATNAIAGSGAGMGDPANWKNGASFSPLPRGSGYRFDGFLDASNPKYGVTSYLDACQVTWRHTYLAYNPPNDVSRVGAVGNPSGPAPSLGGRRNWLYVSCEYVQRGNVYEIVKSWRASGRRGWDSDIYRNG